jgi:hypothetical protein
MALSACKTIILVLQAALQQSHIVYSTPLGSWVIAMLAYVLKTPRSSVINLDTVSVFQLWGAPPFVWSGKKRKGKEKKEKERKERKGKER